MRCPRTHYGLGNLGNQQIGNHAGVERAGAHQNQVGLLDRFDSLGKWMGTAWAEFDFADGNLAAGNTRLALDAFAVDERGDQMNVRKGGRKNAASNRED